MLIISRRVGECFRIGDDTLVKIIENKGSQIVLGISAPKEIKVHREEIHQRILNEVKT